MRTRKPDDRAGWSSTVNPEPRRALRQPSPKQIARELEREAVWREIDKIKAEMRGHERVSEALRGAMRDLVEIGRMVAGDATRLELERAVGAALDAVQERLGTPSSRAH